MKKLLALVVTAVFLALPCVSHAQDDPKGDMQHKQGMHKKMGMMGMMGMCGMGMGGRQMVASDNGSVIVLAGNKLLKYDKNLKLIKETEIKMDMGCMKKMMEQCRMAQEGEEKSDKEGGQKESEEKE